MSASLARICPAVSFWNLSSAAALEAKRAMARSANPVMWNRLFILDAILGRLPATRGPLKHGLQRQTRGLVSEFDVFPGDPNLVAASAGFLSSIETKLVLLDPPLAEALVTHGRDRERAVSLEDVAPMRFIRQLHPWEFRLNLRTRELLEFQAKFPGMELTEDRKSTRLNSSHSQISYAVFCLKKK